MPTVLVTGGCGFIGSNFVRHLLATDPACRVVNFDCLTYAGNLANLADVAEPPALPVRQGRHHRPRAGRGPRCGRGVTDVIHFAAESHVDRSIQDSRAVRPHQRARHADPARRRPRVRGAEVRAGLDRRGVRQPRRDRPLHRRDAAAPEQPVLGQQGGGRPARAGVPAHVRAAGGHHALLEQLRPVPVPREADPAVRHEPARATSRCRSTATAMQVRDWIHVRDHCRGVEAAWRKGKPGEVYNFGGRCEKANLDLTQTLCSTARQAENADPLRRRTARATTAATRSTARRPSANSAGRRRCRSSAGCARRSTWYRRTRPGSRRSRTRTT